MKYLVCFAIICFNLTLFSCHSSHEEKQAVRGMQHAEALMESLPDSALHVLQSLPDANLLEDELQARYCLLLSQALDKNQIPVKSDSLIRLAVRYYKNSPDSGRKAMALFYQGKVYANQKREKKAMHYYQRALTANQNTTNKKLNAIIYNELATVYNNQDLNEEALEMYKQSYSTFYHCKDTENAALTLGNIGYTFLYIGKNDSALHYIQEGVKLAQQTKQKDIIRPLLSKLGVVYSEKGEFQKALQYTQQAIEMESDTTLHLRYCFSLSDIYLQLTQYDKAKAYANRCASQIKNIATKAAYYDLLYRIEKESGNYQKAIEYNELYITYADSLDDQTIREELMEMQQKYENAKLRAENRKILNRELKNKIIILTIICGLLALIVAIIFVHYRIKYKLQRELSNNKKQYLRNLQEIDRYRQELLIYERKIKRLQDDLQRNETAYLQKAEQNESIRNSLHSEREKLMKEICLLQKSQKEREERNRNLLIKNELLATELNHDFLLTLLHRIKYEPTYAVISRAKEWQCLYELMNLVYDSFYDKLCSFHLSEHEKEICCLVRLGLSNDNIALIYNSASESVSKAKTRIKKKIVTTQNSDLSLYEILAK